MRPQSIRLFDVAYLGSLAIGVANMATGWTGTAGEMAVFAIGIAISLALWYFTSFRASNVARWLVVILTGFGVLMTLPTLDASVVGGSLTGASIVLALVLEVAAIVLLFRADARAYFARGGAAVPAP